MAVKDVEKYYSQVEAQYFEMLADAKDYEEAFNRGQISEEQYDKIIEMIDAIKANYERLSYIMFLLKKRKKYQKRIKTEAAEVSENNQLLKDLRTIGGKDN